MMLNNIRRGMMDRKRDGEEHLRRSGVPHCIVRPGRFVDKPAGAPAKLRTGARWQIHRRHRAALVQSELVCCKWLPAAPVQADGF